MDSRSADLVHHLDTLRALLTGHDAAAMADAARRAQVAIEFRDTDAMIGLDPLPPERIESVRVLADQVMERAADLGDPDACVAVAERLYWLQDEERAPLARQYATRAAERPRAQTLLGWFTHTGFGGPVDLAASLEHHQRAAAAGEADSLFELYIYHARGIVVPKDEATALTWCQRAADAGSARAMANLGGFYATGQGVPLDPEEAVRWYTRAADLGHGRAAATLAVMYATGDGVAVDVENARRWYRVALELGYDPSQLDVDLSGLFGEHE
jgi:TPR repeat protein